MNGLRVILQVLGPGYRVKRWIVLAALALLVGGIGASLVRQGRPIDLLRYPNLLVQRVGSRWPTALESEWLPIVGYALVVFGLVLLVVSVGRAVQSGMNVDSPRRSVRGLVDAVYRTRQLALGPRVCVIGGGTGLSTMLRGLKHYTSNIVAVVTVTDDGGSSGKLHRQLSIPPPGDIRNCLAALADEESVMTELLQFRFRGTGTGEGLRDHAFGNLLIAALAEISGGDFKTAVRQASRVLNVRGDVLPATLTQVRLRAEMDDGSELEGETTIVHSPLRIRRVSLTPGDAQAPVEVVEAIVGADVVVIGPGSVYTSVVPNLLVHGVTEALYRTRAKKVYVCNVMTQPGETDGFAASDHLKAIEAHVPRPVVDYVIVNTDVPARELSEKYRQTGSVLVEPDCDRLRSMGYRPIRGSYISQTDVVRHDSAKLAEAILRLLG